LYHTDFRHRFGKRVCYEDLNVLDNLEGYVGHGKEGEGIKLRITWKDCSNNPKE
jgi:hypothetical protein